MSQYLNDLPLNTVLDFRGPVGKLKYLGDGNIRIR